MNLQVRRHVLVQTYASLRQDVEALVEMGVLESPQEDHSGPQNMTGNAPITFDTEFVFSFSLSSSCCLFASVSRFLFIVVYLYQYFVVFVFLLLFIDFSPSLFLDSE